MNSREKLKEELLTIIKETKDGFDSDTPETKNIKKLIDDLQEFTLYPNAVYHDKIYGGHWKGEYFNFGSAGGGGAKNQGVGVTTSLITFSMGQLPDIPAVHETTGLEIDPIASIYNFHSFMKIGTNKIDSHHFSYGRFSKKKDQPNKFFVEFDGFEIIPRDNKMSLEDYCSEIGVDDTSKLKVILPKSPRLWSEVLYMDDNMRIQHGQLGGYYILFKTDFPMYSVNHCNGETVK